MTDQLTNLLAERPEHPDVDGDHDQRSGTVSRPAPLSHTVLALDSFNKRLGRNLHDEWAGNGTFDFTKIPGDYDFESTVSDARGALFEPSPKLAENPADKARAAWMQQLMETPEYKSLHAQTCLDNDVSSIAAKPLCDQWLQYVAQQQEQHGDGPCAPGEGPGEENESIDNQLARIKSTAQALQEAKGDVDAAHDLSAGLGMGDAGSPLDRAALAKYFKRVQNSTDLRAILAMAGRFRKLCRSLQKQKANAIRGELTGIEMSGDIGRLIPMEMLQVAGAVPELETLALYRLANRRSLSYRHRRNEPKKSGPIVVCVDESGSMHGDRIHAAKGLAMAMGWLAQHQNRWIALAGFAGGEEVNCRAFPPKHKDQEGLIDWLLHQYGGGTTLQGPLETVPFKEWPKFIESGMQQGKTDVIIITDAEVDCPEEMRDAYKAWAQQETVKTFGIVIGSSSPGDLGEVCDRYWCMDELDLESEATESVLAI